MAAPIALQLYTIREAMGQDQFAPAVRKVAEMGYVGVETAGFPGTTPQAARQLFDELGLTVAGSHLPLPLGDNKNEVLEIAATLGTPSLICPALRPDDHYKTMDQIKKTAELVNEANAVARANGLSLGLHNHWWEYEPVEGQYPNQLMAELVDPTVFFEIDTYWAKTAGADPVAIVRALGRRAPLLHLKDGPCRQGEPMVALGQGSMDLPAIVKAGQGSTEWLVVELDACASDMLTAVEQSYNYLVGQGLATGR
jgi:sugar phosphate isomerase/epimerase